MQSLTCAVEESDFSVCFVWIPVESLLQCKYITTIHDLPLKSGFMLVNNPSYIVETTDVCFFFCFIFCFIHLFSPWEIWNGDEFQLQRLPLCSLVVQEKLKLITVLGAGLLCGTALAVIIPEGVHALYEEILEGKHPIQLLRSGCGFETVLMAYGH